MLKSVSSIINAIGALNYKGTWDAATNTPTIVSSVGVKGDYYVVSVAGSTNINGISNWGVGDWIVYNGATWQRVEGGADLNGVNLSVSGTTTLSGLTASTALALDGSKNVVSVTNTGTGDNVLATSPTLITPALGTPSSGVVTNLTGTASININGTVGATTANTGNFTTVTASADSAFTSTGALTISKGTVAERPGTPAAGMLRFNDDTDEFEGYNGTVWASVGGGATGGGSDAVFFENDQVVTANYTIPSTKNAMTTGPITVDAGVTVTVSSGARWVVL